MPGADKTEQQRIAERLTNRLDMIESRLARFDRHAKPSAAFPSGGGGALPGMKQRLDSQRTDAEALRTRLAASETGLGRITNRSERLHTELESWIGHEIRRQVASAEGTLQAVVEEAQKDTLDAFVDSVQKRVIVRISRLEQEISRQANVMSELRESSEHTERSMQRLLTGLDRLIAARDSTTQAVQPQKGSPASAAPPEPVPDKVVPSAPASTLPDADLPVAGVEAAAVAEIRSPSPVAPQPAPAATEKPKSRRWSFFG